MIYRTSIGLDVHARSISAAAFVPETGEVEERSFGYDAGAVARWAAGLPQPARAVYESGPTGFDLKRSANGLKRRYVRCDVLVLEDWLLEPLSREQAREILELVEARYRTGSLILCSQYAPAEWHERLGEQATADAVVDRIVYRSTVIKMEGAESMRKRMADAD